MAQDEISKNSERLDDFETRIALTFFGGVSLAIYETGAAVEFFRLITDRDGVYRQLRDKIGPVVVDIISGTSAGALSAAFLANALINRSRNLDPLMRLWLEKADLDELFHNETDSESTSLLNGNKFLTLIEEALREMVDAEVAPEPYQQYLDLFITATCLEGDVRQFQLHKERIEARSHQRVFHFRYRGQECDIDEEKQNDFEPQRLHLLARAARASASFPLAFDPVLIKKEDFGALSPELMDDCHHIDGGILDNKPIKLAIEAIAHRQADKQIDRRLFYVEPLPEEINPVSGPARPADAEGKVAKRLKPINVLYAAVKDLPSYQSITSALEEIATRNRELDALRRTLDHYETLAAQAAKNEDDGSTPRMLRRAAPMADSQERWGPTAATDKYHAAEDIPTQLFRAQEDGYLDLRLAHLEHFSYGVKLPSSTISLLFTESQKIGREIHRRSEEDGPGYGKAHEEFYYLKHHILWSCDFEYHRRQYQYLTQVIRGLFARLDAGEKQLFRGLTSLKRELFTSLNCLRTLFNKQEGQIFSMQQQARRQVATELHPNEELLAKLALNLQELPKGEGKAAGALINSATRRITGWSEIKQRWESLAQLHLTAEAQLEAERARFSDEELMKFIRQGFTAELKNELQIEHGSLPQEELMLRMRERINEELEKGFASLANALGRFYYRDMIIYPMMRGTEMLASELQPIRVARFGPLNGDSYVNLSDARHKIAGEEGLRFGGFMDATWRGNDLIWGRLDAVENIFYQLLPGGREDPLFEECVKSEQRRIVQEMRQKFNRGIVRPLAKQDPEGHPPHEDLLIGKQNLHDIPEEKKVRWLKLGIGRLVRTIRLPGVRFPEWAQRPLSTWTQTRVSNFFVSVLVRPGPAAIRLASVCLGLILGGSILGAWLLSQTFPPTGFWTGVVLAFLWLFFVVGISFGIAAIATSIRVRLKINSPSDED